MGGFSFSLAHVVYPTPLASHVGGKTCFTPPFLRWSSCSSSVGAVEENGGFTRFHLQVSFPYLERVGAFSKGHPQFRPDPFSVFERGVFASDLAPPGVQLAYVGTSGRTVE